MRELAEYAAFERVHGPLLVQERVDIAAAGIMWSILSAMTTAQVKPEDLMPVWDEKARTQTDDDIISKIRAIQSITRKKEKA